MGLFILISTAFINITLGALVLKQDRRSVYTRIFALMSLLITVWIIASYTADHFIGSGALVNNIALKVAYGSAFLVVLSGLWFTYHFPVRQPRSRFDNVLVSSVALPILALSATSLVSGTASVAGGRLSFVSGPLVWLYMAAFVVVIVLIVRNLYRAIGKTDRVGRKQIQLIGMAFILSSAIGLVLSLVLPLIAPEWQTTRISPLSTLLLVTVVAYAIVRYGLFDIRLAVVRSLVYTLSLVTLGGMYVFVSFFVSEYILNRHFNLEANLPYIVLALLLIFFFLPIKQFFDRATNRVFYRDNYNDEEFIARFTRLLASTSDLKLLIKRASREIAETLKAEQVFFFVYQGDHHVTDGTERHKRIPLADARRLDELVDQKAPMAVTDFLEPGSELRRLLRSHRVALILPLVRDKKTVGYVMLGEHRSGGYTSRDLGVLKTLADELVIAVQNAISVQEVREINATLKQRVAVATEELRSSNAELQRLDAAKDEFVSMASHQLRTPLTSVKGYISMVLEGDAGEINDMQKKLLSEAFTSSERMVHLINDFLNVSRLQTGKFVIDRRLSDLSAVIRQEVDSLRTTASSRDLKIQYSAVKNAPKLYVDEGKMRQVIMNFIDNALFYSRPGSTIKVRLTTEDDIMTVTVKDTGIGVPESEQSRLFRKFFRATNARKQRPDGTGVGLYLAKRVVTEHGGRIIFESVEGKGSTFGFELPMRRLSLAPAGDSDQLEQ